MKSILIKIWEAVKHFFKKNFFSIYDRYFYVELFPNYLFGLAFFTALIMLNELFWLAKYYFEYNVPFNQVIMLLMSLFPFLMSFSIPFAILPAYLLTMGRFSQDSEVTAFKSVGIPTMRILRPGIIFGIVITLFAIYFKDTVEMPANLAYVRLKAKIMAQKPAIEFKERAFLEVGNYKISFDRMETVNNTDILYNLYVVDLGGRKVIEAEKGRFYSNPENPEHYILKFMNGSISEVVTMNDDEGRPVEHPFYASFDYLSLNAYVDLPDEYYSKGPEMMTIRELRQDISNRSTLSLSKIEDLRKQEKVLVTKLREMKKEYLASLRGLTPEEKENQKKQYENQRKAVESQLKNTRKAISDYWKSLPIFAMIKYQDKFAMPIASIVFALLSLSIGMYTARSGRGEGLGISIIIMLMYYGSKIATENLITKANLSPYFAWGPNVLFFIVGMALFINKVRK